ncbi:glycosyltransferase [Solirubrobacter ginsenosidimutans]|uniref:Glycosyltransferase n=1 Tax=Solirubrobacter ginsenosidimutans TaxID=490573 RepID=A0A9X3S3J9_9ACTN|nr:glycosyltransferase [Solirubrobacter ginsenosidimutans]MDA0159583.1 glycosyltransferase [Solirubrobacter ginsenosidimutans]
MAAVRILLCASEAPRAPLNGSRLVLSQLCARLAERAEVTVLALRHPDQDGEPPAGIELHELALSPPGRGRAWALRGAALTLQEPVEARRLSAPFLRFLPEFLATRSFDVAHVMLGTLAPIAPALGDLPAVIAPLDAWHRNVHAEVASATGLERVWRQSQERAVRRFEARAYRPYRRVVLVTDEDAHEVSRLDPSLRTATIPNGVDAAHFAPDGRPRAGVVFTGALDAPSNEQAALRLAERIMPLVRQSLPDAALTLVGRSPGPRLRALSGVSVIADVPDLRPYLWGAGVYACPMVSGTGIKNKLLEAMAAGAPAVATPLACQGLAVHDGAELRIADSDGDFAAALVSVLRDPAGLADAARAYVTARHDWDAVAAAYFAVYEHAVAA